MLNGETKYEIRKVLSNWFKGVEWTLLSEIEHNGALIWFLRVKGEGTNNEEEYHAIRGFIAGVKPVISADVSNATAEEILIQMRKIIA